MASLPIIQEKNKLAKGTRGGSSTNYPIITPESCDAPSRGHFDEIYSKGIWGDKLRDVSALYSEAAWPPKEITRKSASGVGSYLGDMTQTSLRIIKDTIKKHGVKSMIDIPCGDANWIFDSYVTDSLPFYLGLDVANATIEVNRMRFGHHKNKMFTFWDATACVLPKYKYKPDGPLTPFDLVHARDVIQHMKLDQGVQFFCNVFKSGARVLITTTYPDGTNLEIKEGSFYHNNLLKEPFSFPNGDCTKTHPSHEPDHTCVYDLTEPWVGEFVLRKCE
eukprot:scaffold39509_cov87-Cyclotella_meneghiniana.AAC.3